MKFFTFPIRLFRKGEHACDAQHQEKYSSVLRSPPPIKLSFDTFCSKETCAETTSSAGCTWSSSPTAFAVYNGGYESVKRPPICLKIANGGAGQTGLVQAWANTFIQHMVTIGFEPFEVAWYLGDTTESLAMVASGVVDVALTYNPAAEKQLLQSGDAIERIYAYRDHFLLVGPTSNPANLNDKDDILTMFSKIVASGNADVANPPDFNVRPATRFLSRFDKSATNIKENQIFAALGQVPWALNYSKWYHQYPRFPREALHAAALLAEYTLIDQGSWLCAPQSITDSLKVFKAGSDDPDDLLLNPAHLIRGAKVPSHKSELCKEFMEWVKAPEGGQKVTREFSRNGLRGALKIYLYAYVST